MVRKTKSFIGTDGADYAAECGHINVLEWLYKRNTLPRPSGANSAAIQGHQMY